MLGIFIAFSVLFFSNYSLASNCPDLTGSYTCPDEGLHRGPLAIELVRENGFVYYKWFKPIKNKTEIFVISQKPAVKEKQGDEVVLVSNYCEKNNFINKTEWIRTSVPGGNSKFQEVLQHAYLDDAGNLNLFSELWYRTDSGKEGTDHLHVVCPSNP